MRRISPKSTFSVLYGDRLAARVFGGRKENEDSEILSDRVEAVVQESWHKDERARFYREMFVAELDVGAALCDIVDFIFGMRLLRVCSACGELIESSAYSGDAQELVIEIARI
jgi:hypothetical protein